MLRNHRTLTVALALALALTSSSARATPGAFAVRVIDDAASGGTTVPLAPDFTAPLSLARLARVLELPAIPAPIIDALVRWQRDARDVLHGAAGHLLAVSAQLGIKAPRADLSVLTTCPIATMRTDESSGFGWRDDPLRHDRRFHRGTDFRAKPGTPVLTAGDGVVVFAGQQTGYGNVIYVDHGGGVVTRYAHLSRIETKKDAAVAAGSEIGKVGSTGRTTGPHLHFEIRLDGNAVDPVLGMSVAELERDAPGAGELASYALAPELQATKLDGEDHTNRAHAKVAPVQASRPDRAGRVKRTQALW